MQVRYKLSILNLTATILLLVCGVFIAFKYDLLADGDGWGLLAMTGLAGVGLLAMLVDFIAQQLIKDRLILNVAEVITVLLTILSIYFNL